MHVVRGDAEDILDDAWLLRRITPSQHRRQQADGSKVVTSFAFREQANQFSMYVAAEVTHEKVLSCGFHTQAIIEVLAGEVRGLGYDVIREPDDCDDSHVFARARGYKSKNQVVRDCKTLAEFVNSREAAHRAQGPPAGPIPTQD